MKTAMDCRARAAEVRAFALKSSDPVAQAAWTITAEQWDGLAKMADDQEALEVADQARRDATDAPLC